MNKCKKIVIIILIMVILLLSLTTNIFSVTITLDQIVSKFNSSNTVTQYAGYGTTINAVKDNDKIILTASGQIATSTVEFTLNNNILSTTINVVELDDMIKPIMASILIDCIGQLNGYADGESFATLNSDQIESYTLANEGLELKDLGNDSAEIKIDITKKFPLLDMSDTFIEVSDLQDIQEYISGDGSTQKSKGNLIFWKGGYGNEVTIVIGEKNNLTENAYKSILSGLEVMFNSKDVVNYFKTSYSSLSKGNKEFTGFKVEINPTKNITEKTLLGTDYNQFVRITIDKEKALTLGNSNTEVPKNTDNSTAKVKIPETGTSIFISMLGIVIVGISCMVAFVRYTKYKDIK